MLASDCFQQKEQIYLEEPITNPLENILIRIYDLCSDMLKIGHTFFFTNMVSSLLMVS